jgi:hypothetical protein
MYPLNIASNIYSLSHSCSRTPCHPNRGNYASQVFPYPILPCGVTFWFYVDSLCREQDIKCKVAIVRVIHNYRFQW